MASVAALLRRAPAARRALLRDRRHCTLASASAIDTTGINSRPALTPASPCPRHSPHQPRQHNRGGAYFSSLAEDYDDDDDDELPRGSRGDGSGDGGSRAPKPSPLLPTRHSRNLPPPVCPPSHLRSEVEALFDAPVGSLIVYAAPSGAELKSAEEEMSDAYYASDAAVQRAEYVMRGLNAMVSNRSFVARSVKQGAMKYEGEDSGASGDADEMAREDAFRAMLDLLERMTSEGEAYAEVRTRVRSQLMDPSGSEGESAGESGYDSSSSSSSDSDSDSSDEEGGTVGDRGDESIDEWTDAMDRNLRMAGYPSPNAEAAASDDSAEDKDEEEESPEAYQFGADPGTTVHMYDLVLDALACLCQEQYGNDGQSSSPSSVDLVDLMPDTAGSPPELAKDLLDVVLHRHWIDGGDVGLGNSSAGGFHGVGRGIGAGAGTGAGALAQTSPFDLAYDVRTCPTPMTFNAVLRIAANFDPAAHAEAAEHAKILSGAMGNASSVAGDDSGDKLKGEQERLRDATLDAAMSTYARMQMCAALTLRSLKASTRRATSREALKRQFRLLDDNYAKHKTGVMSGRNGATYAYLLQTVARCVPPSLSRGNMAFALYHFAKNEGVLNGMVAKAMGSIGGYGSEDGGGAPPVIKNGPIFDDYIEKELGSGIGPAMEKGRRVRYDRNSRLRRHVEWDDTY